MVECLPVMNEAWVLSPVLNKQDMVVHTCNYNTQEVKVGEGEKFRVIPGYIVRSRPAWDT